MPARWRVPRQFGRRDSSKIFQAAKMSAWHNVTVQEPFDLEGFKMKFSKQLTRRYWRRKDAATGSTIASGEYPEWHGRFKGDDDKHWKWRKFYTDKRASEKAWEQFKQEMEQRAAGVILPTMTHAKRSVTDHAKDYLAALKLERVGEDHHR